MFYLSKRFDSVSAGCLAFFWAAAITAMLVKETDKLTLGQELFLTTLYSVEALLRETPDRLILTPK